MVFFSVLVRREPSDAVSKMNWLLFVPVELFLYFSCSSNKPKEPTILALVLTLSWCYFKNSNYWNPSQFMAADWAPTVGHMSMVRLAFLLTWLSPRVLFAQHVHSHWLGSSTLNNLTQIVWATLIRPKTPPRLNIRLNYAANVVRRLHYKLIFEMHPVP